MTELAGAARIALVAVREPGPAAGWPPAHPAATRSSDPGKRAGYEGRSASRVYDKIFRAGPQVPHLAGHVPQGLATWRHWNGGGATLLLLGMYRAGAPSYLVGINPSTGRHVGTLRTKATHFGALGVSRGWLITQDNVSPHSAPTVRRYKLSTVRKQMKRAARTGTKPYVGQAGKAQRVAGASFLAPDGGSMWIGRFRTKPSTMYRYTVGHSGRLTAVQGPVRVPARTQGLLATRKNFVFATSGGDGRGKLTVVRRSAPAKSIGCVWTPSLPQNMTTVGGRLYAAYESGAARFNRSDPANRIRQLHTGSLRSLNAIVRLDPEWVLRGPLRHQPVGRPCREPRSAHRWCVLRTVAAAPASPPRTRPARGRWSPPRTPRPPGRPTSTPTTGRRLSGR